MDILIDNDYDLVITEKGDFVEIISNIDKQYQDLSILLNIDFGQNRQFPNLGVAIYKEQNGVENQLFSKIKSQAIISDIDIKNIYNDVNNQIQIII